MDGFALRAADVVGAGEASPRALPLTASLPAATTTVPAPPPACAARIMTGAPLPPGADTIVPVERTDQPMGATELPASVAIHVAAQPGAHVRRRGEDIEPGDPVLAAGTVLGGAQLASAASRSEEHTSELQSRGHLVCRLLLEKKNKPHTRPRWRRYTIRPRRKTAQRK